MLGVAGCAGRSRSVLAASGDAASTRLELTIDSCNENPTAEVEESAAEVRVRVTSGRWLGRDADDCADGTEVILKTPLGTRRIIDDSTGEVVELQPAEDDTPPK